MRKLWNQFKSRYFSPDLHIRARLFHVLALAGVTISVFTAIQSLIYAMWMTAAVSILMAVLSGAILKSARTTGNYRRYYYVTVFVIFLLFFPILFFTSGGYKSGMPAAFIFAALFTMLLLDGWQAFAMLGLEMVVYIWASWISFYYPDYVIQFPNEYEILKDIQFSYVAVSLACGTVVFIHLREYNRQRRQLEEKNEILRQMDEAKTAFLNTVAHEVKNPLNIISLHAQDSAELLEETPTDVAQLRENQKIINDTVMRMDRILRDLMDTVSIEQGRLTLSMAPVSLQDVMTEVIQPWSRQYQAGKLHSRPVLEIPEELPPIMADHERLHQVLANLLINAFRHTPQGTVTLSLRKMGDGEQLICVEDNGEGMDEATREKALQGYVSASRDYWRHGIGLYVCHQIVSAHHGRIRIESQLGKGTRVYVTLPEKGEG